MELLREKKRKYLADTAASDKLQQQANFWGDVAPLWALDEVIRPRRRPLPVGNSSPRSWRNLAPSWGIHRTW